MPDTPPPAPDVSVLGLNRAGVVTLMAMLIIAPLFFWIPWLIPAFLWLPWLIPGCRASAGAGLPVAAEQRRKLQFNYVLTGFYALGLLIWPILVFSTFFFFDSPHPTSAHVVFLMMVVMSIWYYPIFLLAGFMLGNRSAKLNEPWWRVGLKTSLPAFAVVGLGLPALLVAVATEFWSKPIAPASLPPGLE
ncbi:MAG TPA: hypothetical protein VMF30_18510 [Pirellulales bacterium]|nr:hypothetical protein [Pirellulales bacterium]